MKKFIAIWIGQVLSTFGSKIAAFGISVWIYEETGSSIAFVTSLIVMRIPSAVITPFAGLAADRIDRNKLMVVPDLVQAATISAIGVLYYWDMLQVWHLYVSMFAQATSQMFQDFAFETAVPTLVEEDNLERANSLREVAGGLKTVASPLAGGMIFGVFGLGGCVVLDAVTFVFGIAPLLIISIPRPSGFQSGGFDFDWEEMFADFRRVFRYMKARTPLFTLMIAMLIFMFAGGVMKGALQPMVLDVAGPEAMGRMLSFAGVFGLISALLVSTFGLPDNRYLTVLVVMVVWGAAMIVCGISPSVIVISVGFGLVASAGPLFQTCIQTIWHENVPEVYQGRFFSLQGTIGQILSTVGLLLSGFLADYVFAGLLVEGGRLSGSLGSIIGVGPGRASALVLILLGCVAFVGAAVWASLPASARISSSESPDDIDEQEGEEFFRRVLEQQEVFLSLPGGEGSMFPVRDLSVSRRRITVKIPKSLVENAQRVSEVEVSLAPGEQAARRLLEFDRLVKGRLTLKDRQSPDERSAIRVHSPEGTWFSIKKNGGTVSSGHTTNTFRLMDMPVRLNDMSTGGIGFVCEKKPELEPGEELKVLIKFPREDDTLMGEVRVVFAAEDTMSSRDRYRMGAEWLTVSNEDLLESKIKESVRQRQIGDIMDSLDNLM